jgi:hypothetical protein
MKKFKKIKFYLVSFFLLLPCILNAEKIGLLPFKQVGIESNITEAVHQLMGSELSSYGYTVLLPNEIEEKLARETECYNKECAAEIGNQIGLEKVIFGSLTKIGEKYIISAVVVESQSGNIIFSDKVTSQTAEDLDVCISRLAKSIEYGKEVKETAEIGTITEQEVETEAKRKKAFFAWGGGFGVILPVIGYNSTQSKPYFLEFKGWYETPRFAVTPNFQTSGCLMGYENLDYSFDIYLLYFFSTKDFSPFVSGGVGVKTIVTGISEDSYGFDAPDYGTGINLSLGGGLVLFRTYDFRLVLDGRLSTLFNNLGEIEGPHSSFSLGINVIYKKSKDAGCLW